jgi:hypothetical protein
VEEEVATFMSQLEDSHAAGIDDLNFDDHEHEPTTEQGEVEEEEVEEVEVEETQTSAKKSRASNYSEKEDVALCYAWMNVSLNASVGTDQSKEKFWARIEDYYNNTVEVPITRTQGSLGHRWGAILECCNRWAGCVETVTTNPPSGVPVTEHGPLIQDLYKIRNKKNGGKGFTLHHCFNELAGNEKWVRRNWETTPKRSRVSISIDANDEEDEDPHKRPEGQKLAKERKRRGAQVGGYKEELCAMVETKKALAAERRDEKAARWGELKAMEQEKWKKKMEAEERRALAEERRVRIEEESIAKEKEVDERAIMFMDPSNMDAMARKYWELTRAKILRRSFGGDAHGDGGRGGGGGGGGAHGDGDGGRGGGDGGGGDGEGDEFFGDGL